jgi:hypothetical protein
MYCCLLAKVHRLWRLVIAVTPSEDPVFEAWMLTT